MKLDEWKVDEDEGHTRSAARPELERSNARQLNLQQHEYIYKPPTLGLFYYFNAMVYLPFISSMPFLKSKTKLNNIIHLESNP